MERWCFPRGLSVRAPAWGRQQPVAQSYRSCSSSAIVRGCGHVPDSKGQCRVGGLLKSAPTTGDGTGPMTAGSGRAVLIFRKSRLSWNSWRIVCHVATHDRSGVSWRELARAGGLASPSGRPGTAGFPRIGASQRRCRGGGQRGAPAARSARTNDVEARKARRSLGWPGRFRRGTPSSTWDGPRGSTRRRVRAV